MKLGSIVKTALFFIPDVAVLVYLYLLFKVKNPSPDGLPLLVIAPVIALFAVQAFLVYFFSAHYYFNRLKLIGEMIREFKKGRFFTGVKRMSGRDELALFFNELTVLGKHMDDIVTSQKNEIEQLREMYNNVVLSISSYFLVLGEKNEIVFANESFCKKFQYDREEIYGKRVEDVFVFLTGRIMEALLGVKKEGETAILERTHLLSRNRISVIADIKFSRIDQRGASQVIMVIDDITSKCRKDYQISLISQISESIQRDSEIDTVLYTILTGVTSGSGLGFNRAMLFLVDGASQALSGKMAVGPDSLDEAIEIWSNLPPGKLNVMAQIKDQGKTIRKGMQLLGRVLSAHFPLDEGNLLVSAMQGVENIHVFDAGRDERVSEELRAFIDVNEFVIVPLMAGNKPIGVIVADNKFNQMPIGNDSIELLSIFAFQASLSIESYNNLSLLKKEMQKLTDRQEAIVESEKLAAVGRIASHIAHEIRNPLVTVGGYARRVEQLSRVGAKKEEMIHSAAEVILKESERLEKVLSNVMDFTRPAPYIREFNSVNDVIKDTVDLLRNLFQERRIEIRLNLMDDIPLVKSDFNQMKQVLLNLVQNAMDLTPQGGRIEIATCVEDTHVRIAVRDSGPGIKPDDMERLFEPFFTTKVTGVGLGLAIVKKIVTDHGGEITAANRPGGGAEFIISLELP